MLRPGNDPALSPNPAEWQVELIVGRQLEIDCNRTLLRGQIRAETVPCGDPA
ncbi:MAG: ecotin family protein [Cyanobium sp.]